MCIHLLGVPPLFSCDTHARRASTLVFGFFHRFTQPYNVSRDGYIKANVNGTSFYRVNYPANVWAALHDGVSAQVTQAGQCFPSEVVFVLL